MELQLSPNASPNLRWEDRKETRWGQGQLSVTWAVTSGESTALVFFFPVIPELVLTTPRFSIRRGSVSAEENSPIKLGVLLDSEPLKALGSSLVKLPPFRIASQS